MPDIMSLYDSDYLYFFDLADRDCTVTIDRVEQGEFIDRESKEKNKKKIRKPVVYFVGKTKGLGLCKTNTKTIIKLLGTRKTEEWKGKKITLYPTTTNSFGETVGCIRVRNKLPE